jgi:hypothetical protein
MTIKVIKSNNLMTIKVIKSSVKFTQISKSFVITSEAWN